jgi:hypothetical protein
MEKKEWPGKAEAGKYPVNNSGGGRGAMSMIDLVAMKAAPLRSHSPARRA